MTITPAAVRGRRPTVLPALLALAAIAVLVATASPAPARAATTSDHPLLAQGAGMGDHPSPAVRRVQRVLDRRGYDLGAPGVDGRFGPITAAAVRRMQARAGLVADGLVGPRTRRALGLPRAARVHADRRRPTRRAHHTTTTDHGPATTAPAARAPARAKASSAAGRAFLLALAAFAALVIALIVQAIRSTRAALGATPRPAAGPPTGAPAGSAVAAQVADGEPVIGYVTLAATAPVTEADRAAQALDAACDRAGWRLVDVVIDHDTGRGLERPGLTHALREIAEGRARRLVVSDLRRLSPCTAELGELMEWFGAAGAALVALDLRLDTSTPAGREVARTLITIGGWERESIPRHTRGGLTEGRAQLPSREEERQG